MNWTQSGDKYLAEINGIKVEVIKARDGMWRYVSYRQGKRTASAIRFADRREAMRLAEDVVPHL